MLNKKSQMEILGLAIVIILVLIGLLFVVKFIMVKKPAEFKAEFTQKQLAQNMVTAFLNSNAKDCFDMSITELLQDCGQSQSIYCDNGKLSCAYVQDTAEDLFRKTLDEWNLNYIFLVYFQDINPIIDLRRGSCAGDKKVGFGYIPTAIGTLNVRLDICE